ncbi:MAG: hypothetical protein ACAI35_19330 [Candidatus Methylacidiphilales bacterium]|nr:hypothetical protein [Candidatus Methylacidiphilales bacterium]
MFRYITAAFFASPQVPGVGRVPLNLIAVIGTVVLGAFVHPSFYAIGGGLEIAYLYALATNPRFQQITDAISIESRRGQAPITGTEESRRRLINRLSASLSDKYFRVEQRCKRIIDTQRENKADSYILEANRLALDKLLWTYLKLVVASHHLGQAATSNQADLEQQIAMLKSDISAGGSPALMESKRATLTIAEQRLANFLQRKDTQQEIASDLARIDAELELAQENATVRGANTERLTGDIPLASHVMNDVAAFGDSSETIRSMEQDFLRYHAAAAAASGGATDVSAPPSPSLNATQESTNDQRLRQ